MESVTLKRAAKTQGINRMRDEVKQKKWSRNSNDSDGDWPDDAATIEEMKKGW